MHRPPTDSRNYGHLFLLVCLFFSEVLAAVDQQKLNAAGQQWYEKGWKPTTSANVVDSSFSMGRGRSRVKAGEFGSGMAIGDLDEGASAVGVDDEDSDVDLGSGVDPSDDLDIGSGGISLPSTVVPPAPPAPAVPVSPVIDQSSVPQLTTASTRVTVEEEITTTILYTVQTVSSTTSSPATRQTTATPRISVTTSPATQRKTTTSVVRVAPHSTQRSSTMSPKKEKPSVLDDPHKMTPANFWMLPGVLAGLIGGAIVGLLAAILLVMFVVYRMRKKDEGSYALEEPKSPPNYAYAYQKAPTREFYA